MRALTRTRFRTDPDLFGVFYLAEKLGKTVFELLFGYVAPISALECRLWPAFWTVKRELEEESEKKSSKGNNESSQFKMLGQSE